MSAGNGSATADPAQCKRMHKWPLILLSCSGLCSLKAGSGPPPPAPVQEPGWVMPRCGGSAGAGGQAAVLPGTRAAAESASTDRRAVMVGVRLPPCLTFPLDFSEHIFGYKQFLRAARSEVGSHLLCKCYTWINTFLGLLNPSPLCVCFPADTPLTSEASIFPESQQR